MYLIDKRRPENSEKAFKYLQQAVAIDPNYAKAWAAQALAVRSSGRNDNAEIHRTMMEVINKALSIDPNISEAYGGMCLDKLLYEYDFAGAEASCKQAIRLDPNSSAAHREYSMVLRYRGRYEEALAEATTAIDLEPMSYVNHRDYAYALYRLGRFDEAAALWRRLSELDPADPTPYNHLIRTLEAQGKEAEALELFIGLLNMLKRDGQTIARYQAVYQTSGWRGVLLERAKDPSLSVLYSTDFQRAMLYARAGEKDKAFEHLERSFQKREWAFAGLLESPYLESIRDDPRYADLVKRLEGK